MEPSYQLVGNSPAIRDLEKEIEYAARTDAKVLITGESGVGKEVVARLIHQRSRRSRASLVTINCAGLPDTLLETELFGHMRGSFTDAYRDKKGLLESANGGTAFLDEIGEMSLRMQALLLRFLETGEVQRVGSERIMATTDVRIIAATNRNLQQAIADKTFREDLFYRINVVHLWLSPLRDRVDDIEPLVDYYMARFARSQNIPLPVLTPAARSYLLAYRWPGNVRELKNIVERVMVRVRGSVIDTNDLPAEVLTGRFATSQQTRPAGPTLAETLYGQIVNEGHSFWTVVYEPFMSRDITREDVRMIVTRGLEQTHGNYKSVLRLFNIPAHDYKRFLNYLRKYRCQMPFQRFRNGLHGSAPASATESVIAEREESGEESSKRAQNA